MKPKIPRDTPLGNLSLQRTKGGPPANFHSPRTWECSVGPDFPDFSQTHRCSYDYLTLATLDRALARSFNGRLHVVQFFSGVTLPVDDFANHAKRVSGAIRHRRIAWIFFVGQVRIIFNRSGRLDHVDSAG